MCAFKKSNRNNTGTRALDEAYASIYDYHIMKNICKFFSINALLVVSAILFTACPNPVQITPIGYFLWEQEADGNITITGYNQSGPRSVIIPEQIEGRPVTFIGLKAFFDGRLTSVTIPNSVTLIGYGAFSSNQLTRVNIGNGVETIGEYGFSNNLLTSVAIPNSVINIAGGAFRHNRLTSVTIPDSVRSIGVGAFYDNQLTSLTIGSGVTTIEFATFANNQLRSITIPQNVTLIRANAFTNNQLSSITIGSDVILDSLFGDPPFENNFDVFYNNNNRRAGTYTWNGSIWSFEG